LIVWRKQIHERATVSPDEEATLLSIDDLDSQPPAYFTHSFQNLQNSIHTALLKESDIKQIDAFLDCLAQADPSFQYRRVVNRNGHETGYIWQTGVMRRDF
jgi:hypothetical protein